MYSYFTYDHIFSQLKDPITLMWAHFIINTLIFYLLSLFQLVIISHITFYQLVIFFYFTIIMLIITPPIIRKPLFKALKGFYHITIHKILGKAKTIDKCAICWQEMDTYAGLYEIEEIEYAHGKNLVRVHKKHIFHAECLFMWRMEKSTCPLDNEPIDLT